ncbi:MAG: urease accessory protein UreD [Ilumatobacteraceae bacterium]
MRATTTIEVGLDARGHTVAHRIECEVPLLVRVADTPGPVLTLLLVNGAAGPLGGDRLRFRLEVGPGAHVIVRSVAATMAQPGPSGEPSSLDIELVVGGEATLDWAPEPIVSVQHSRHRTSMHLTAAATSTVSAREVVSLGRHRESPGHLALHQRVTIDGSDVLRHDTVFAAGPRLGPGAHGTGRTMSSEVLVGTYLPSPMSEVTPQRVHAVFHLSPVCALLTTRMV